MMPASEGKRMDEAQPSRGDAAREDERPHPIVPGLALWAAAASIAAIALVIVVVLLAGRGGKPETSRHAGKPAARPEESTIPLRSTTAIPRATTVPRSSESA